MGAGQRPGSPALHAAPACALPHLHTCTRTDAGRQDGPVAARAAGHRRRTRRGQGCRRAVRGPGLGHALPHHAGGAHAAQVRAFL